MRDFFRPARPVGGGSGTKFSLLAQNGPKSASWGVLGEFCIGWAYRECSPGEFCTGIACWGVYGESFVPELALRAIQNSPCWCKMGENQRFGACWESFVSGGPPSRACWESFVPASAPRAVQSSPCSTCWWWERNKVLPAGVKRAEMGHFGGAGGVLYRCRPLGCELGEFCTGCAPVRLREGREWKVEECVAGQACLSRRHDKTARRVAGRWWSGRRESNPPLKLGKLPFYR